MKKIKVIVLLWFRFTWFLLLLLLCSRMIFVIVPSGSIGLDNIWVTTLTQSLEFCMKVGSGKRMLGFNNKNKNWKQLLFWNSIDSNNLECNKQGVFKEVSGDQKGRKLGSRGALRRLLELVCWKINAPLLIFFQKLSRRLHGVHCKVLISSCQMKCVNLC